MKAYKQQYLNDRRVLYLYNGWLSLHRGHPVNVPIRRTRTYLMSSLIRNAVILLPAHPASFAHKFLFQRVPGCNSIADLSLKIMFWTDKFAVGTH